MEIASSLVPSTGLQTKKEETAGISGERLEKELTWGYQPMLNSEGRRDVRKANLWMDIVIPGESKSTVRGYSPLYGYIYIDIYLYTMDPTQSHPVGQNI